MINSLKRKITFGLSSFNNINKFYKNVAVSEFKNDSIFKYKILLDNRNIKNNNGDLLLIINEDIANLVRIEFEIQTDYVVNSTMTMFRLSKDLHNFYFDQFLIDNSKKRVINFFKNDVVYTRDHKDELRKLQGDKYDSCLTYINSKLGLEIKAKEHNNILSQNISDEDINTFELKYLNNLSISNLFLFDNIVKILKSVTLSIMLLENKLTVEEALDYSRLEESYQYNFFGKIEEFHDFEETELRLFLSSNKIYYDLINN